MAGIFAKGGIVSQDPILGVPVGKPWIADQCLVTVDRSYIVTDHSLMLGAVATDAIKRGPETMSVVFTLSDDGSTGHPVPGFPGRSLFLLADFMRLEARRGPCTLFVRGYGPLRDYAMQQVTPVQDIETKVTITVGFKRLSFTSLFIAPIAMDAELLAAGIIPL